MSRTVSRLIICAALITVVVTSGHSPSASRAAVRVGVLKGFNPDLKPALFRVLASCFERVMKDQTGLNGELVSVATAEELRRLLGSGEVHLGVFHGFEFAWAQIKQPDLEPLMVNVIDPGALEALVVVPADSPSKGLGDCRGTKLTLVGNTRSDARLFLARRCRDCGAGPADFFAETLVAPNTEHALDDVVDGDAALTVVDRCAWENFQRRKPGRSARLRVLERSEAFAPSIIAYRKGCLDEPTLQAFRDGMRTAHTTTLGGHLMALMRLRRFDPIDDAYRRQLTEVVKAYPPDEQPRTNVGRGGQ